RPDLRLNGAPRAFIRRAAGASSQGIPTRRAHLRKRDTNGPSCRADTGHGDCSTMTIKAPRASRGNGSPAKRRGRQARKRSYVNCPTCLVIRMRLLGDSDETFGSPPTAVERYYGCPGCGLRRAYDIRRQAFRSRLPKKFSPPSL